MRRQVPRVHKSTLAKCIESKCIDDRMMLLMVQVAAVTRAHAPRESIQVHALRKRTREQHTRAIEGARRDRAIITADEKDRL